MSGSHLCLFLLFLFTLTVHSLFLMHFSSLYSIHSITDNSDFTPQLCSQYNQLFYSFQKNCLHYKHSCRAPQYFVFLVYPDALAPFGIAHD